AVAILVAADNGLDLPVVSDSSFADLPKLVEREASKRIHLPRAFSVGWMLMSRLIYGTDLRALRPVEAIHKLSPGKVLLIHGAQDEIVPVADAHALQAASNNVDGLWIVPEAAHGRGYKAMPKEYISRVVSFFDRALAV
ncbi:MAG: alpha/beta hydrolase, partial [Dehalococcoidia bacterium]